MHKSAMLRMEWFVKHYVKDGENVRVLDVGSYNIYGCYKELFEGYKLQYVGLDLEEGPNVDFIPKEAYSWDELEDESFDYIISGNAFEHIEFPWLTIREIYKKLKWGGFACILAPNSIYEHRYPTDCYRYYEDGFRALAKWGGFTAIDVTVSGVPDENVSPEWTCEGNNDTMMVLIKTTEDIDLEAFPKFKCERRYKHAFEWCRRYFYLLKWIETEDREEKVEHFIQEKGFRNIYVYGYGPIGKLLYELLQQLDIGRIEIIDKNADDIRDLPVLRVGEEIDESEDSCMLISVLDLWLKEELDTKYKKICKYYVDELF
ncbi:MAG: class I SAM-dependent methyltransferase [Hespellia sp.]|jgi:SAM-dependent methyltransferase|nr:class I SAM-dependent methyltransferase [Hespellia sp.]